MKSLQTTSESFDEIDIYGSDEYQDMVMDVLFDYSADHLSLHKSFNDALELVRRAVWRNYGEATYLKYEKDIRRELFDSVASYTEFAAIDNIKYHRDYECSIREFYEREMEPFLALDCLYVNCVDIESLEVREDDSVH